MVPVTCPGCGAEVSFRAGSSVFAVCSFCQATLVRRDLTVEQVGTMALVDEGWSPLQLNTQGRYRGVNFIVVGRIKLRWERGVWNEWFLSFDDGRTGWMSEAQGFYSVSFASEYTNDLAPENGIFIGAQLTIHDLAFTVQDIKRVRCEFSEGELPFAGAQGRESTSFDLSGNNGTFACIEHAEDGTRLFVGSYEEFDALDFINLRPLDGWSDPTRKSI